MAEPKKSDEPLGSLRDQVEPSEEWLHERAWDTDPMAAFEVRDEPRLDDVQKAHQKNQVAVIGHAGVIIILSMYFFSSLFLLSLACWVLHYIAPEKWQWMSADQLSKIQAVIFSGSLGAITTSIAQKYFKGGK